ncbi:MAG: hypothetical protein V3V08_20355, partial [Nannocystaceae bacterium]
MVGRVLAQNAIIDTNVEPLDHAADGIFGRDKDPEDTIDGPKPGARSSVNEAPKLVAQRNILGDEICTI